MSTPYGVKTSAFSKRSAQCSISTRYQLPQSSNIVSFGKFNLMAHQKRFNIFLGRLLGVESTSEIVFQFARTKELCRLKIRVGLF